MDMDHQSVFVDIANLDDTKKDLKARKRMQRSLSQNVTVKSFF